MYRPALSLTTLALTLALGVSPAAAQHYHSGPHSHQHDYHYSGHDHFDYHHYHEHGDYGYDHLEHGHHDDYDYHSQPVRTPDYAPDQLNQPRYNDGPLPAYDQGLPGGPLGYGPQGSGARQPSAPYPQELNPGTPGPRGNFNQPGYRPGAELPQTGPYDSLQGPFTLDEPADTDYQPQQFGRGRQPSNRYDQGQLPNGVYNQGQNYPGPYEQAPSPRGQFDQGPQAPGQYNQGPLPNGQYSQPGPYQYQGNQQTLPLPGDRQTPNPTLNGGLPTPPGTMPEILPLQP